MKKISLFMISICFLSAANLGAQGQFFTLQDSIKTGAKEESSFDKEIISMRYYYTSKDISVNTPVGRFLLSIGSGISFYRNSGNIESITIIRPGEVNTPAGKFIVHSIYFFESGKISSVGLKKTEAIDTIVGKFIVKNIYFFESGKMRRIRLDKEQQIKTDSGKIIETDTITFDEKGNIQND